MTRSLYAADLPDLDLLHRGKVRDVYALPENRLLIVATDRLSAFDVVLPDPIPGKGEILCGMSNFWFNRTSQIVPNHLTGIAVESVLPGSADRELYGQRSMVAKRLTPLPLEAIARGYLIGSGWRDYRRDGTLCGIALPPGLRLAERLPEPLFTPSTKAATGSHDENVPYENIAHRIGNELAERVRATTLAIYRFAADFALARGIIIADTKLEFGLDQRGELVVMDEMLTPDSSRFWPLDGYAVGSSPNSFDKQFVRDYLETLDWNKTAPGPRLPAAVIEGTRSRYLAAWEQLTGGPLDPRLIQSKLEN